MDLTTLAVAVVGLAGTLTSPLLGQRIAASAKQQELDFQLQQQREEREEAKNQSALELKRTIYAELNTASRQYQQQLEEYLRLIEDHTADDEARAELASSRKIFRDLYSEAQMILPDDVLRAALLVSAALGDTYGITKRLEIGKPRTIPEKGPETFEMAKHSAHVIVYNNIVHMRHLMRTDLGVTGASAS